MNNIGIEFKNVLFVCILHRYSTTESEKFSSLHVVLATGELLPLEGLYFHMYHIIEVRKT